MNSLLHRRPQTVYAPAILGGTGGTTGVDSQITTIAGLAAIPTVNLTPPILKLWIKAADKTAQIWELLAGTDATVPGSIQRPDDYNASTNAKVWYKVSNL